MTYDLITMGRVGVDLYPEQVGVALADVRTFAKSLGGSATNVAVAAARLGARAAVITKVGDDPFGPVRARARFAASASTRAGSAPIRRCARRSCSPSSTRPTTSRCSSTASRQAPDMTLAPDELDLDAIRAARVFWTTGTGLSAEPSRAATLAALARPRRAGSRSTTSTTGRCSGPTSRGRRAGRARRSRTRPSRSATATRSRSRSARATPTRPPTALLDLGVELAIVKRGPEGVLARTRDERVEVAPVPVDVVCGLGAGDAFGGALVHGLLHGWPLERTIRLANAAGAHRRRRGSRARTRCRRWPSWRALA